MTTLTPTQQKDLKTYRETGELGSLSSLFIEDCHKHLESFEDWAKHPFSNLTYTGNGEWFNEFEEGNKFIDLPVGFKIHIIQTLLSRTNVVDGSVLLLSNPPQKAYKNVAVMPFLDVEVINTTEAFDNLNGYSYNNELSYGSTCFDIFEEVYRKFAAKTLDELLYREFTEALRLGKGFDFALETINKLYIDNIYV